MEKIKEKRISKSVKPKLSPKQKAIAVLTHPKDEIDAGDLAVLRKRKKLKNKKAKKKDESHLIEVKIDTLIKEVLERLDERKRKKKKRKTRDPKVGTGKKPPGSSRRLYTDEDPSDTVPVEFSSAAAVRRTFARKDFKSKSHKRQSQIINLVHQRARAAYKNAKDPKTKARLKRAFKYAETRKEASKKKTKRLQKSKKKR